MYLLLQTHYAGPLLLEQTLVLLARRIVEGLRDICLFSKGSCCVWRIYNAEVCNYGFVPALTISGVLVLYAPALTAPPLAGLSG